MLNIIIPMAGRGSRFSEAGYTVPKPLIEIDSKPMIQLVMENLSAGLDREFRFLFIVQQEHIKDERILSILTKDSKNIVVPIDYITEGPADSVSLAMRHIDPNQEVLIANSDQFVDIEMRDFHVACNKDDSHGLIMTFMTDGNPKWSYVRKNAEGLIIETKEKVAISDEATVGVYYFKKAADFNTALEDARKNNIRVNNEFYVCPLYNELISRDRKIYSFLIEQQQMWGLGTPDDLNRYLSEYK